MNKFFVYSREQCHLCHDMEQDLRLWQTRLHFDFEVVEVDEDKRLLEQFGLILPVLISTTGEILCYGRLNVEALTSYLSVHALSPLSKKLL